MDSGEGGYETGEMGIPGGDAKFTCFCDVEATEAIQSTSAKVPRDGAPSRLDLPLVSTDSGLGPEPCASAEAILRGLLLLGPFNELRRKGFVDIGFGKPCIAHVVLLRIQKTLSRSG